MFATALCAGLLGVGLPARARELVITAAGDLALSGPIGDPLADAAAILPGDVRLLNLEGPLTARGRESGLDADGRPLASAGRAGAARVRFAAPPERAAWLRGRVDVASLANNHALDQGEPGRADTVRALARVGVASAFAGHDAELERAGRRIVVIARELPPATDLDGVREPVDAVRARAHSGAIVLVSLHWGHTGSLLPTAAQRRLGHRLIDAGATAVFGHGPHTLQGYERHGRGVIAYSLGNLAFGCRCTDVTDAYALTLTLTDDGTVREVLPRPLAAGLRAPAHLSPDPDLAKLIAHLSADLSRAAE